MQLIGEPESTLDIEINMSTVDNIKNNKTDDLKTVNLDIENFQDIKVNGNERDLDLNGDSKCEESEEEVVGDIHDTSTNVPMNISKNEVELSNADFGEILTNKNKEINEKSQNGVSGSDSDQNDVMEIDESKETEEDYLEDDIISIIAEPIKEVTPEVTETEDVIFESPLKEEVEDDKKEHLKVIEIDTVEEVKDEEEIKVERNAEQSTTNVELQSPIEEIDSDHVIAETQKASPIQGEKETNMTTQQEEDTLRAIESLDSVCIQNESHIPSVSNDNDIIDESNGSHVSIDQENETEPVSTAKNNEAVNTSENNEAVNTAENNEAVNTPENNEAVNTAENNEAVNTAENNEALNTKKSEAVSTAENNDAVSTTEKNEMVNTAENSEAIGVIPEENHSLACEKNIVSPTEQLKIDDIQIEDEGESTVPVIEDDNGHIDISKESEENSNQSNKIIDTEIGKETESTRLIIDTLVSPSSEARDIKINEDLNTAGDLDENQKESHTEVKETEDIVEPMEVVNTEKASEKTSKCDSDVQDSNTNSVNVHIDNHAMDVEKVTEDSTIAEDPAASNKDDTDMNSSTPVTTTTVNIDKPIICKLSNTLDILSDDEDLPELNLEKPAHLLQRLGDANNKSIDLEDDDDVMVIDEETDKTETKSPEDTEVNKETAVQTETNADSGKLEATGQSTIGLFESHDKEETSPPSNADKDSNMEIDIKEKTPEPEIDKIVPPPPLIPDDFVKTAKNKLSDMTRDDLEEFCILKIVESIIDRSSLSDIQNKLKCMTQGLEEYRKKAMTLSKQNRDLQLVLKSVQEEQKKVNGSLPITPLKITRSVGMQVYMEKISNRKKVPSQNAIYNKNSNNAVIKTPMPQSQAIRPQKQVNQPQNIPVPRLVPANSPGLKTPNTVPHINPMNTTPVKINNTPNGINKTPSPTIRAEKRQHNKVSTSMTVDLTDDEPPTKMPGGPKAAPTQSVRLVPPQNLMAPQRHPFTANVNSPRKVYIPISGPQSQALRPGQTIMLKTVPATGIRPRTPQIARGDPNAAKLNRIAPKHPAPLPVPMKQYQPPNWKSLPPGPELKLSKVENGIVISWKIESPSEESYEEIASYQLYAYQETTQPPSTSLWKKIGDVKALPLPMACTLTQFMAGFKYYFAVRAVDIRSRLGPFSCPGSILLLNKTS